MSSSHFWRTELCEFERICTRREAWLAAAKRGTLTARSHLPYVDQDREQIALDSRPFF